MSSDNENNYERHGLGLVKTLEKRSEICDIEFNCNPPVANSFISAWEQKHSCIVPDDLRSFYLLMNGISLTWNVKVNDIICIPVGKMIVNPLEKFNRLTLNTAGNPDQIGNEFFLTVDEDSQSEAVKPKFDERSRIFELDPCDGHGKVCLCYCNTKPGLSAQSSNIWFLDRALRFHFLSDSFVSYYRMMVAHLGLPQWQYAFTDVGLSTQAKQWFNIFCPIRLVIDAHSSAEVEYGKHHVQLDFSKVFKGKTDKKKPIAANQVVKKKPILQSTTAVKPGSGKTQVTTSAQSLKPSAR